MERSTRCLMPIESSDTAQRQRISYLTRVCTSAGKRRVRAMHAIRKVQIRWVAKGDPVGQRQFIHTIFGIVT